MESFFDESEWVLADKALTNTTTITDWVITDGDEGSVAGVFFHTRGRPFYASFARNPSSSLPDPSFSFLPPNTVPLSSSRGLVLLRGPWSSYFVADPSLAISRPIPRPPRPHPHLSHPSPALVVSSSPPNLNFHLVCAIAADPTYSYRFEIYSSKIGKWVESKSSISAAAKIVPGSGVSAAGVAYWRTISPAILAYDPEAEKAWTVAPPARCAEAGERWQLGEAAGGGLCCTVITETAVVVYGLNGTEWRVLGTVGIAVAGGREAVECESGDPIACVERPWPLRFESANLEAVLWVDGRVVAVDLESRRVRTVEIDLAPVVGGDGGGGVGHVAGIGGLVAVAPVGAN